MKENRSKVLCCYYYIYSHSSSPVCAFYGFLLLLLVLHLAFLFFFSTLRLPRFLWFISIRHISGVFHWNRFKDAVSENSWPYYIHTYRPRFGWNNVTPSRYIECLNYTLGLLRRMRQLGLKLGYCLCESFLPLLTFNSLPIPVPEIEWVGERGCPEKVSCV